MADSVVFGMSIDLAKLRSGLSQAVGLMRGATGSIERAFTSLANPFAALGLAAAGGGLALMIKSALELGDSLDEMSSRVGVGVVALQELQHAAKVSGASAEELETALKFLNKNLGEAATGDEKAIRLFGDLGISIRDAAGNTRDAGSVIDDLAQKIADTESPAERTRLALQLLGRSGTSLIPMLEGGRAGMAAFRAEANRLGLVLDADMVKAAGKAKDELDTLATAIQVNLTRAVVQFTPELLNMAAKLNEFMGGLKNVIEFFGKDQSVGVIELTARLGEARAEAERLQKALQDFDSGRNQIRDPSAPGGRNIAAGQLGAAQARVAALEKLLAQRTAPEAGKKPGAPIVTQEQLDKIDQLRQKVIDAAIPDPVAQSIVKFRVEVEKLAAAVPSRADEIRALGKAFQDVQATAESAKKAITDTQAATLAQSIGLPDTNVFAGLADIDKVKSEADQFGQAIQRLVKDGQPLSQVFALIGETQDALSLKTANLREKFAQQPIVLEQIKKELAGIDFGGFQKSQDALARSFTGVAQGAATVEDPMGNLINLSFGLRSQFGAAGEAGNFLAGVLFSDMPVAAATANASLVVLTAQADLLAKNLARARLEAILLAGVSQAGGTAGPAGAGNTQ